MKRLFDFSLSLILIISFSPLILLITFLIKVSSKGPVIHWSKRVGRGNNLFLMPKFRTMLVDTPNVATHLLENPQDFITPIGRLLRKSSLDELPQLYSILKGEMSFVGPRPALFNQDDLISKRNKKGIDSIRPGVTGWAQINGRDNITIGRKVELDQYYLQNQSFLLDLRIIFCTLFSVSLSKNIIH
jgi:O-antigen biosynthesis protein WbqP